MAGNIPFWQSFSSFSYAFFQVKITTSMLIKLCSPSLQDIRKKLEESLPGTGGGRNPHDQLVVKILFILPFCLLLFGYYQSCFQTNKELISIRSLCAFARRARHKYKSEEPLPSYSVVGSSSAFGISNQRVSPLLQTLI